MREIMMKNEENNNYHIPKTRRARVHPHSCVSC